MSPMMGWLRWRQEWRLRSTLAGLLFFTSVITFLLVGTAILSVRIPWLEEDARRLVSHEARVFAAREDLLLSALEDRLNVLASALPQLSRDGITTVLNQAAGNGQVFRALYVLDPQGRIESAGLPPVLRLRRDELLGRDLSGTELVRLGVHRQQLIWGDQHRSALSDEQTLGLVLPLPQQRLLLAEVPLNYLLDDLTNFQSEGLRSNASPVDVWVISGNGEVMADSAPGVGKQRQGLQDWPLLQQLRAGQMPNEPGLLSHEGRDLHVALQRSHLINWVYAARTPAGLANKGIRAAVLSLLTAFGGTLLVGLLLAPFWASGLVRALRAIVLQAHRVAEGHQTGRWPRGRVLEFNRLSADLQTMAERLRDREDKRLIIFNTAPVPMVVSDLAQGGLILEINDACERQLGYPREQMIGQLGSTLGLWRDPEVRDRLLSLAQTHLEGAQLETEMVCANGRLLLCRVSVRQVAMGPQRLTVWALEDITEHRQAEQALQSLNQQLEVRVAQRTEALQQSNAELAQTVDHLTSTRSELVRAEKMAALGSLVAGVAHELNTPLGNSLMAVTTFRDELRQFRDGLAQGLRRSALEGLLESAEQATRISSRNLERAAELVTSFKQVAADQTSSQRRRFDLREVIDEIVLTLKPSFARQPYRIEVQVPTGLVLDSYPGPLGQVLTNLITNAITHGFDGRDHGRVLILAEANPSGDSVLLRVEDDGHGIPPGLIERIFDPFVTTRMGRGGTGLGLNIAYNVTANVLGGDLQVSSAPSEGSCFRLRLPWQAPTPGSTEREAPPAPDGEQPRSTAA
ncbi:ATP-binding protein [Curvibacter sp. RS43]|uniref:PAS domain-containing sensor histidine kinase n=1 Tax=Curvibacter microcysteis TaxID=3026419 RepID=UPI002360CFB4|nr:ATP-binding protein [Curvibacter sp. RS43]MDD0811314.1 ATP-binding protein [Curvibacter sp. RS43]